MKYHIAILISGSGTNMQSLILKSREDNLPIEFIVISDNENAEGLLKAKKLNVKTYILKGLSKSVFMNKNDDEKLLDILSVFNPDYILLAGFMRIISERIINKYNMKIVNIHPALLPSFKGKDAQKQAFEYGVKISGATVHFIDKGVDTGPIILQECVDISHCNTVEQVKQKILKIEHNIYYKALNILIDKRFTIKDNKVIIND